jgi:hypothetical protein
MCGTWEKRSPTSISVIANDMSEKKHNNRGIEAIRETASRWHDPDHPPRQRAIERTLDAPNRWTEQALDHALDRWIHQYTIEGLERWLGTQAPSSGLTVGGVHGEEDPFSGLRFALAACGLGVNYVGTVPESSPALLPAFVEEVAHELPSIDVSFGSQEEVLDRADVVLASPREEREAFETACEENDLPESRRFVQAPMYSVGLVDGHESEDEMERLAEDMLLYEGKGRRRLAILWAPRDHSPDAYLEAMARFRGLFPAHEDTPGALQMQQAFLEAQDEPHAYAEGLEFLLSRGEPAPQQAGHVRWAEYDELQTVTEWTQAHEEEVYAVIARRHLHDQCPEEWTLRTPGGVHVPPLDDEDGRAIVRFLQETIRGSE